jgi:hypothetical protein
MMIAACGGGGSGGDDSGPPVEEIAACISGIGFKAEVLEGDEGIEGVGAQAPDGDVFFVIEIPGEYVARPDVPARMTRRIRQELRQMGRGGILMTSTANHGSTFIGVLGVKGVRGGLAAASTEVLARKCATVPPRVSEKTQA